MPVACDENGIWIGDGKGGLKRIEPTITEIEIYIPGKEDILIQDDKGIVIKVDPETGLPQVLAETITISSEPKTKPNIFARWLRRKEG